jgi:hypothetical protein
MSASTPTGSPTRSPARSVDPPPRTVGARALVVCGVTLAALWTFELLVVRTHILATRAGQEPAVPLYAFWDPLIRWQALAFVAVACAFVALAARIADPARCTRRAFLFACGFASVLLPLALYLVRSEPSHLGREFVYYEGDEFYFDARRILDWQGFLRNYVAIMPRISLHGQHFPPGHALLLYAIGRVFGPGTLPAGIACLVAFAIAIQLAYGALARVTSDGAARQGVLLLFAAPSMLDFACASMDAVFLCLATGAWWLALVAFGSDWTSDKSRVLASIAAGVALFVATFFSFSIVSVGLALAVFALVRHRARSRNAIVALACAGAGYVATAVALQAASGFSILDCLQTARANAKVLMTNAIGASPSTLWPELSFANPLAFAIGAGVALVAAAFTGALAERSAPRPWTIAAVLTLVVMSIGGIYFLETERIWLFAMPWLSAIAVSRGPMSALSLRTLLAVGLAQAAIMEALLFTLW